MLKNMSYSLLTGDDFNWTTNVPFPLGRGYTEPFFTLFPDKKTQTRGMMQYRLGVR